MSYRQYRLIEKIAGTDFSIRAGALPFPNEKGDAEFEANEKWYLKTKQINPSLDYHYSGHGKYMDPVDLFDEDRKLVKKVDKNWSGFSSHFVPPKNMDIYIKKYDNAVLKKLLETSKDYTDPKGVYKDLLKEHKKVLRFMKKNKKKGMTVQI